MSDIEGVLAPLERWARDCHGASVALVRSGVLGECRVARGSCIGVGSQHSWVVLGRGCYDDNAEIIDPTLWSYQDREPYVWSGSYADGLHRPHGKGSIWEWGRPNPPVGPIVTLTPSAPLSQAAEGFLELLGPLDLEGWGVLAHAPVEGWPAAEIIGAMYETAAVSALIPIDIVGMLTDHNPRGLYLPEELPDAS